MENKEILDRFGKLVVEYTYDDAIRYFKALRSGTTKWGTGKEYTEVLNKLTESDKDSLYKYFRESLSTAIFSFLQIFEEHPEFKIVFEDKGKQIDLNAISEMLKSEHQGDDGWIKRFSKEINVKE
jgi:hypothetical protein